MLRCLIVEDEPLGQLVLERYIGRVPEFRLLGKCSSALEAFEALHAGPVDLIFLDIRLPVINGMDFLRSLKDPPLVVFTTAYPGFAAESYDLEAVDYLVKPITEERFRKCVDKVLKVTEVPAPVQKDYLFIKVDGQLVRILLEEIVYIESLKDYLKVVTGRGVWITHMTMKAIEGLLPPSTFVRVHRSYLVSLSKISTLGSASISVGDKHIPVGESYRKKVAGLGPLL